MSNRQFVITAGAVVLAIAGTLGFQHVRQQQKELAEARAQLAGRDGAASKADTPGAATPTTAPAPAATGTGRRFSYEYLETDDPDLASIRDDLIKYGLFERVLEVRQLDGKLDMPRTLKFQTRECGQVNAFYNPEDGSINICYELLKAYGEQGAEFAVRGDDNPSAEKIGPFVLAYFLANARFATLHEFGHALIHELELPATGREEDAADQVAATLMLIYGQSSREAADDVAQSIQMAAYGFLNQGGEATLEAMADEHSLNEQRFFNLQCLLYGSDPAAYVGLVTGGKLPQARSVRCQRESQQVVAAWTRLISPHLTQGSGD